MTRREQAAAATSWAEPEGPVFQRWLLSVCSEAHCPREGCSFVLDPGMSCKRPAMGIQWSREWVFVAGSFQAVGVLVTAARPAHAWHTPTRSHPAVPPSLQASPGCRSNCSYLFLLLRKNVGALFKPVSVFY